MEDLTIQEQRAALERTFFHDISNVITGLLGASSMMQYKDEHGRLVLSQQIQNLIERLSREVEIQRCLNRQNTPIYQVSRRDIRLGLIIEEIENLMCHHPLGRDKFLIVNNPDPSQTIQSDQTFLLRILTNMILNAFEASNKGDEVRLMIEADSQATTFSVWNPTAIPEDIGRRIFQRYFTTKPGAGRGLGTYTMKLLGEVYLGGEVAFHTSEMAGTTFWLKLPVASSPAEEARPIAS
jgi:signal transduction histidine kinase